MRIISKFHDYYDTALGFGVDSHLRYVRETREVEGVSLPVRPTHVPSGWPPNRPLSLYSVYSGYLIFCGKLYPYLDIVVTDKRGMPTPSTFCWSFADTQALLKGLKVGFWKPRLSRRYRSSFYSQPSLRRMSEEDVEAFFAEEVPKEPLLEMHHSTRAPIARYYRQPHSPSRIILELDPQLQPLGFASVVDPFAAFQEIAMFIGGVLSRPEKEALPISDELKRDTHGFDDKSFKTLSPGKKHRRRER